MKTFTFKTVTFGLSVCVLLSSCSTGSNLRKFDDHNLEKEIPKEVAQKFEVKEVSTVPTSDPAPAIKKNKPKEKKLNAVVKKNEPLMPPIRKMEPMPFHVGEKLEYDVRYLGVTAATLSTEVLPEKIVNDRKVFQLRGRAKTLRLFELVYRANDVVESFFDHDGMFSHRYTMDIDESKQSRKVLELYDYERLKSYYWNRIDHVEKGFSESKEEFDIKPWAQDPLSYLYFVRVADLPKNPGQKFKIPVIMDGKQWESVIQFAGKDRLSVGSRYFDANVYHMENYHNGELKNKDNKIWISTDANRYLLRVETKVKVGSFAVALDRIL